jgi:hypothetical protein
MNAAVAAEGFMKNSNPHFPHFLLFSEFSWNSLDPQMGQYLNLSNGCFIYTDLLVI